LSSTKPYSQDTLFEQMLLALYRNWYALPRRSTLPVLDRLRIELARQLEMFPEPADVPRLEQALIDFARAARALPGVEAAGGDSLRRLADAQPFSVRIGSGGAFLRTDASPARRKALVELLRTGDPAAMAITAMYYPPQQSGKILGDLLSTLEPTLPRLSDAARNRVEAVQATLQTVNESTNVRALTETYLAALAELEQIPEIVRVASAVFTGNKTTTPPDSQRSGAYSPGDPLLEATPAAASPDAKDMETSDVDFQVGVQFPTRVRRSETNWLQVSLLIDFPPETPPEARLAVPFTRSGPGQRPPPEVVEVRLAAPDFDEETGCWDRTIMVYPDRNSQPAIFLLKPKADRSIGKRRIAVDFLHKGRPLGSVSFATEVVDAATTRTAAITLEGELARFDAAAPPPADLEIRVVRSEAGKLNILLNSARADVPFHNAPVGELDLGQKDPQIFVTQHLERLSQMAAMADAGARQTRIVLEVARIGEMLFELLPATFHDAYWNTIEPMQRDGLIRTILVYSDEPWIPWELLKPYRWDSATDTETLGRFFAEGFAMSRWLTGRGPAARLAVQRAALIMPELDLAYVQAEKRFFDDLAKSRGVAVAPPMQHRDDVLDSFQRGDFQVLHVATHGNFNSVNVEQSELNLVGGSLKPVDLSGSGVRGIRRAQPLIFLNACYSGQVEYGLVGLGGWAQKFCAANVSAFVGTLWEVSDELAAQFSQTFYGSLIEGKTLGEAMLAARTHVRQLAPANPTWLAYTLYGDPNALVTIGGSA